MTNPATSEYGDDSAIATPTVEAFKRLDELIREMAEAERASEESAAKAKKDAEIVRRYEEELIPAAMDAIGQKECTTLSGRHIKVVEDMSHSLAAERKEEGFRWLEENGHGGIIRQELVVNLAKGQNDLAARVIELLQKSHPNLNLSQRRDVAPATLKSLLKTLMQSGVLVPLETFKIRKFRKAKIE